MRRLAQGATAVALGLAMLGIMPGAAVAAALGDAPPRDVNLSGSWVLEPTLSDNPQSVLDGLRRSVEAQQPPRRLGPRSPNHRRDEDELTGDDHGAKLFREIEMEALSSQRAKQMEQFADILSNPAGLKILQRPDSVDVVADYDHLECTPGERVSVVDTAGAGARVCGWLGPALVVLLKRQRGSSVERRYELNPAQQTLTYTTTLTDGKLPVVKLRRSYRRAALSADVPAGASAAH